MQSSSTVVSSTTSHSNPAWLKRWFSRETLVAWVFIFPSLVGFITFYAVPAVRGLIVSFTNWDMLTPAKYVGFDNCEPTVHRRHSQC